MFYELRQYRIHPGRMDEWVEFMEKDIIPFQVSRGMVITGSWRGEEDDTVYVWMGRFESEAERERLYEARTIDDIRAPRSPRLLIPRAGRCSPRPQRAFTSVFTKVIAIFSRFFPWLYLWPTHLSTCPNSESFA